MHAYVSQYVCELYVWSLEMLHGLTCARRMRLLLMEGNCMQGSERLAADHKISVISKMLLTAGIAFSLETLPPIYCYIRTRATTNVRGSDLQEKGEQGSSALGEGREMRRLR